MFALLLSLVLSLVILVQIKLEYSKPAEPLVKHDVPRETNVAVTYIMPSIPLVLKPKIEVARREVIPDRRAQYRVWKDNLRDYEQVRLKLYTQ